MKWHQSHTFRGLGSVDTFREYVALESCLFIGERPYISGGSGPLASITTRRVGRAALDSPAWRFRAEADPSSLLRRTPPYRMLLPVGLPTAGAEIRVLPTALGESWCATSLARSVITVDAKRCRCAEVLFQPVGL